MWVLVVIYILTVVMAIIVTAIVIDTNCSEMKSRTMLVIGIFWAIVLVYLLAKLLIQGSYEAIQFLWRCVIND